MASPITLVSPRAVRAAMTLRALQTQATALTGNKARSLSSTTNRKIPPSSLSASILAPVPGAQHPAHNLADAQTNATYKVRVEQLRSIQSEWLDARVGQANTALGRVSTHETIAAGTHVSNVSMAVSALMSAHPSLQQHTVSAVSLKYEQLRAMLPANLFAQLLQESPVEALTPCSGYQRLC